MSEPKDEFLDRLANVRRLIRERAEQEQREIAEYLSLTSATGSEIYNLTGQQLTRKQINTRQRMRAKQLGDLKPFKRKQRAKPFLTAKDLILLREMRICL